MTWFKEIPIPLGNDAHLNVTNFKYSFKKLGQTPLPEKTDLINDLVLQWIIVPFVFSINAAFHIPTNDSKLKEYTYTNLTNLFNSVREVYADGKLVEIRLEALKQDIKNSFIEQVLETNKADPLVSDFYLNEKVNLSNQLDIKLFKVDINKFTDLTVYHAETDHIRLWDFINKLHLFKDEVTLFPSNWMFNDRLLESPFLIFLSRYASEVVLTVNYNDLNVRAISFKGKHQPNAKYIPSDDDY